MSQVEFPAESIPSDSKPFEPSAAATVESIQTDSKPPDLPAAAPVESKPEASPVEYSALVIDDNFFNRDVFRIALESAGYHVTEVEDPVEGNELLTKQTFNLMILDLYMPKMKGGVILDAVRKLPMHNQMYVVVVTADAHRATEEVGDLADFVMLKPIDVMTFARFTHRLQDTVRSQGKMAANPLESGADSNSASGD